MKRILSASLLSIILTLALVIISYSEYDITGVANSYDGIFLATPFLLFAPNGSETISSGFPYTIEWQAPSEAIKFKLYYSLNNGTKWKRIVSKGRSGCMDCHFSGATCADCHIIHPHTYECTACHSIYLIHEIHTNTDTERYIWKVPCPTNNKKKCLVKVIGYDSSDLKIGEDVSDSTFTIEVIWLMSPNGGERLISGYPWHIMWQTNCTKSPVATVELYYKTGGAIWNPITTLTGDPGSYTWKVPYVSSTNCKVKVILKDENGKIVGNDVSDRVFSIQP